METVVGILLLAVCLVVVVDMVKRDSEEYGAGCAFALVAFFIAVVFVAVAGMLTAYDRWPK